MTEIDWHDMAERMQRVAEWVREAEPADVLNDAHLLDAIEALAKTLRVICAERVFPPGGGHGVPEEEEEHNGLRRATEAALREAETKEERPLTKLAPFYQRDPAAAP